MKSEIYPDEGNKPIQYPTLMQSIDKNFDAVIVLALNETDGVIVYAENKLIHSLGKLYQNYNFNDTRLWKEFHGMVTLKN